MYNGKKENVLKKVKAIQGGKDKYDNYKDLVNDNYYVVPIAHKTMGSWAPDSLNKEVKIVYRLFLVSCYLLHVPRLPSQPASTEKDLRG